MRLNLIATLGSDRAVVTVPYRCLFLHRNRLLSVVKHEGDLVVARSVESGFHYKITKSEVVSPVYLNLGTPRVISGATPSVVGPWRSDIENAPKDGTEILCKFMYCGREVKDFCVWHNRLWASHSTVYEPSSLLAFADLVRVDEPQSPLEQSVCSQCGEFLDDPDDTWCEVCKEVYDEG